MSASIYYISSDIPACFVTFFIFHFQSIQVESDIVSDKDNQPILLLTHLLLHYFYCCGHWTCDHVGKGLEFGNLANCLSNTFHQLVSDSFKSKVNTQRRKCTEREVWNTCESKQHVKTSAVQKQIIFCVGRRKDIRTNSSQPHRCLFYSH